MAASGLRRFAEKFDDELKFFKGWIDKPKAVGSIVPTSSITARRMASIIDTTSGLPVLEVGPGTGVITRAILGRGVKPQNLYAVEYSHDFVRHLRRSYPGVNVIEGDAFDLDDDAWRRCAAWSSTASSPACRCSTFRCRSRVAYLEDLLDRIPQGRPVVQLTYGPKSPVPPGLGDYTVEHFDFVLRNIPPTQLWIYRRAPRN